MATGEPSDALVKCVQCGKEYKESENSKDACTYHAASYNSWGKSWYCCGRRNKTDLGCKSASHRSSHHTDYRYGPFVEFVASIMNYTNMRTKWAGIEDAHMNGKRSLDATVGVVTQAGEWKGRLFVQLQSYWNMLIFTCDDIKNMKVTKETQVIKSMKITKSNDEFNDEEHKDEDFVGIVTAQWYLGEDQSIQGVTLTCQTETSMTLGTKESVLVTFGIEKNSFVLGEVKTLSKGGISEGVPSDPNVYAKSVPKGVTRQGVILPPEMFEIADEEEKVGTPLVKKRNQQYGDIQLKVMENKSTCNANSRDNRGDWFYFELTLVNRGETSYTIMDVEALYQAEGDENWGALPAYTAGKNRNGEIQAFKGARGNEKLPLTVAGGPGQMATLHLSMYVPYSEDDLPNGVYRHRSWHSRFVKTMNFQIKFIDLNDDELVYSTSFTNNKPDWDMPKKLSDDNAFVLREQNPFSLAYDRFIFDLKKPSKDSKETEFQKLYVECSLHGDKNYQDFDINFLKSLVFKAKQQGTPVLDLNDVCETFKCRPENSDNYYRRIFALVDLSCLRVYAFRVVLRSHLAYSEAFYVVPLYNSVGSDVRKAEVASEEEINKAFCTPTLAVKELVTPELERLFRVSKDVKKELGNVHTLLPQPKSRSVLLEDFLPAGSVVPPTPVGGRGTITGFGGAQVSSKQIESIENRLFLLESQMRQMLASRAAVPLPGGNVSQWTNKEVCNWVFSIADTCLKANAIFEKQKVTGAKLVNLDKNALQGLGIEGEPGLSQLLAMIRSLKQ